MLGKKLTLMAASVALAMGHVAATREAMHIKIHVAKETEEEDVMAVEQYDNSTAAPNDGSEIGSDSVDYTLCLGQDESEMSVEGVEGIFCVTGQACVDDIDGACPGPQDGLEYGSYCGTLDDTADPPVLGCMPKSEHDAIDYPFCSGDDESEMSVEGVEGVFCVTGQACVDDIDGACPGPQDGLEYGSYCGALAATVDSPVLGCMPKSEPEVVDDQVCLGDDESEMSVEGVEGIFCVTGQACVADIDGACPGPQDGLEYGSHCDTVEDGIFGCLPDTSQDPVECLGDDESEMSVEGVEGVFCVTGQACVDDITGACPGPQTGLDFGAYCDIVEEGVLGCKPHAAMKKLRVSKLSKKRDSV